MISMNICQTADLHNFIFDKNYKKHLKTLWIIFAIIIIMPKKIRIMKILYATFDASWLEKKLNKSANNWNMPKMQW